MTNRIDAYLICGGSYHDFDFARLELLKLLAEQADVRVRVAEDFSDTEAIEAADMLITYTCDIAPSESEQTALKNFLSAGKRWYALHGTNSLIEWLSFDPVTIGAPRTHPQFMQMLGSQFLGHPEIGEYQVEITAPDHPLVAGLTPFETTDELYIMEHHGDTVGLLHTHFDGNAADFAEGDCRHKDSQQLVWYLHPYDKGEVLYLTLGHCRSKYDMQPLVDEWPTTDRCSWELPEYYELLRRGIRWAAKLGNDAA